MVIIVRGKGAKITIKLEKLKKYAVLLTAEASPERNTLINDWVELYKQFIRGRFRGGANWPRLRPRTRKRVAKRSRRVLVDSKTLLNVWNPRTVAPGYTQKPTRKGVRLGYGGGARHPIAHMSVARLASIHARGLGRVPKREIVVEPSERYVRRMQIRTTKMAISAKQRLGMK